MIHGESNVYLTIAPGGGLAGVHLDQEGAARTQASLIGGVVACVPVVADFRALPVSTATDNACGDPHQPAHAAGSYPGDCRTCSESVPLPGVPSLPHGPCCPHEDLAAWAVAHPGAAPYGPGRGLAGQVAANAETRARRACCGSAPGRVHLPGCAAGGDRR